VVDCGNYNITRRNKRKRKRKTKKGKENTNYMNVRRKDLSSYNTLLKAKSFRIEL